MRFYLAILLLFISVIIAYLISIKYKMRKEFFYYAYIFNKNLYNEVSFSKATIPNLLEKLDKSVFFNMAIYNHIVLDKKSNLNFLSLDEKNIFNEYFNSIGKSDVDNQILYLINSEKTFDRFYETAKKDDEKYRPLCLKLGFIIGIILFIVII